jgi:hypothetical protein
MPNPVSHSSLAPHVHIVRVKHVVSCGWRMYPRMMPKMSCFIIVLLCHSTLSYMAATCKRPKKPSPSTPNEMVIDYRNVMIATTSQTHKRAVRTLTENPGRRFSVSYRLLHHSTGRCMPRTWAPACRLAVERFFQLSPRPLAYFAALAQSQAD